MGFTCTKFTGVSGEQFNCCQRPGQIVNDYKDCAQMPREQTLHGFKNNNQCKSTCEALTKYTAREPKIFSCKGMVKVGINFRGQEKAYKTYRKNQIMLVKKYLSREMLVKMVRRNSFFQFRTIGMYVIGSARLRVILARIVITVGQKIRHAAWKGIGSRIKFLTEGLTSLKLIQILCQFLFRSIFYVGFYSSKT